MRRITSSSGTGSVLLELSLSEGDVLLDLKQVMLGKFGLRPVAAPFRVRSGAPPPAHLMAYARLVVLQEHDLPLLPLDRLPERPLGASNEDHAFRHLAVRIEAMLGSYPTTVEEDEYALEASKAPATAPSHRSSRRDAALAAVMTEKQLLLSLLGTLNRELHEYLRSVPTPLPGPARRAAPGTAPGPTVGRSTAAEPNGRALEDGRAPPPPRRSRRRHKKRQRI